MFGALLTWLIVGIGLTLYRREPSLRRPSLEPSLVVAGIAGLVLFGALAVYGFKARSEPSPAPIKVAEVKSLTSDQRQFRIGLKQFALTCVPNLGNAQARVFAEIKQKEAEISKGAPYSVALYFFIHFSMSAFPTMEEVRKLAEVDIESIDIDKLQHSIEMFFGEYSWRQSAIANLNVIVKLDIPDSEAGNNWLSIDKECRTELHPLKKTPS
jgi:hypothetical protein